MKKILLLLILAAGSLFFIRCGSDLKENGTPEYISKIKDWHSKRINNLKRENGWLNLAGLYWLKEGENKFGSDKGNDVIFPAGKAPAFIGSFILKDSIVTVKILDGVDVKNEGTKVTTLQLKNDTQKETILEMGSLRWFIIKRGDKYGVRLRDLESKLLKTFTGIETFPINSDWRFEASIETYITPKKVEIPNIIGTVDTAIVAGALTFEKDGIVYKLDPLDAGRQYFIVFADETSGKETYGAGRFLYVDKADSAGKIIIDFNKAYNPPCAFTKYATCPLPPRQNHLKLKITAGERDFHGADH
ncbi:MAG: hypothetical protein CVV24_00975 [Ignavibacteriae bacterium HGW-Ignavibacteriae-3]|nr:MAG: hypothetical protein CVV24_00975 [Ignavibacteriae bacterium HGW-Ignavibacteriae-3]